VFKKSLKLVFPASLHALRYITVRADEVQGTVYH
jgi:hypothetical protein